MERGGGGVLREGGGDLRTRAQGRGGLRYLFFWGKRKVAAGWEWGRCSGNCPPPPCMSSPPSPPVSPTHADHKRSQNDPKMILVSFWYHFDIVLVSFWYHVGIIGIPVVFCTCEPCRKGPSRSLLGGAPRPPPNPEPTPPLPSQHSNPCLTPSTRKRVKEVPLSILAF